MPFGDIFLYISFASRREREPISVHLIDAYSGSSVQQRAAAAAYSYPITKLIGSNWTAVIGHPRDQPPITYQICARRTNHNRAFRYRYDFMSYIIRLMNTQCYRSFYLISLELTCVSIFVLKNFTAC